ncbi:hypothetical protein LPUS_03732 [Lasallia pustulata]|uniref:Nuclear distribution protein RO10 n=1 Tax=Lasallia pustulata TaxID=136370 RepID=A0A1W5CVG7_9LECA|nr:hypothetical protein LPUS_03732 [Lasallia pustulata]
METLSDKAATETIERLEHRLRSIEYILSGDDEAASVLQQAAARGKGCTTQARITRLENALSNLSSKIPVVQDLLRLHACFPDLFQPVAPKNIPTSLTTPELFAVISSYATLYPTTASRLTSLQDLPIPAAERSASLISLQPRLAKLELQQQSQARELAELRWRTAAVIQRWYELGVLGGGECWTEWEERMEKIEKKIRQTEVMQAREADGV